MIEFTSKETTVIVDLPRMIIYDKERPQVGIHIYELGSDKMFHFNKQQGIFLAGVGDGHEANTVFQLPELVKAAPEIIAEMYGYSSIRQLPDRDYELNSINDAYSERVSGRLPQLDIDGVTYTVDGRLAEIRRSDAPFESIKERDLPSLDDGRNIQIWDQQSKAFADTRLLWEESMTKHHKIVLLPPLIVLDPVGLARSGRLPDYSYIAIAPVQMRHKAQLFCPTQFGFRAAEKQKERVQVKTERQQRPKSKTRKSL